MVFEYNALHIQHVGKRIVGTCIWWEIILTFNEKNCIDLRIGCHKIKFKKNTDIWEAFISGFEKELNYMYF